MSASIKKPAPERKPIDAINQGGRKRPSAIAIAGSSKDQKLAATITPAAKPSIIFSTRLLIVLKKKTKAYEAYGKPEIKERHRHRYEFNDEYLDSFEKAGMLATGVNPDTGLIEIIEIEKHKWFVGVQYHPEYKSTVLNPHPLFVAFVKSTLSQ